MIAILYLQSIILWNYQYSFEKPSFGKPLFEKPSFKKPRFEKPTNEMKSVTTVIEKYDKR